MSEPHQRRERLKDRARQAFDCTLLFSFDALPVIIAILALELCHVHYELDKAFSERNLACGIKDPDAGKMDINIPKYLRTGEMLQRMVGWVLQCRCGRDD